MDSPGDMQAEKERIFLINFFIFFFYWRRNSSNERGSQWGDGLYASSRCSEGLDGAMAFTANG